MTSHRPLRSKRLLREPVIPMWRTTALPLLVGTQRTVKAPRRRRPANIGM